MPLILNTNLTSLNAQRYAGANQSTLASAMQRLSSGMRVNSAKDDAAGLAIAERMSTQVRGMQVAIRNANDAISLASTAENALGRVNDILQRMRELAVQSANGTNGSADRTNLNTEYQELAREASRTLSGTAFNGTSILATTSTTVYQVGANTDTTLNQIQVASWNWTSVTNVTTAIGANVTTAPTTVISGTDSTNALSALSAIDNAITSINTQRATFGAVMSRFDNVINTLQVGVENQSAARSRIVDADYAAETANMSRANILQQASNAMVAQANQQPQQVLQLLRG